MSHIAFALPAAARQTWPPFVLVTGLLLIGVVAASDGLFEAIGGRLARLPGGGVVLFGSLMSLVAAVTVILNLDTSVVFLTPILLHAARRRRIPETAFLYGAVFMSNSASLLLPGSNLTNLLVLDGRANGGAFAVHMLPAWVAAVVVTAAALVVWRWRELRCRGHEGPATVPIPWGLGLLGVLAATVLVLVLQDPALPVLGVGIAVAAAQLARRRLATVTVRTAVNVFTLCGLFLLAISLGTMARVWGAPGRLVGSLGTWATAGLGAGTSALVNNLPAAVLLSSSPSPHVQALLVGLDLGPNLVVTGALSAILWMRVARREEAQPSALTYSRVGIVLVPVSMAASLLALQIFGSTHL